VSAKANRRPAAVFAEPDARLVALNRFHVPRIRRRLETIRHQLVVALGALHSATVIEGPGGHALPGTGIETGVLCSAAYKALGDAFEETEWLAALPDEVLDGHAPDCDQREELEALGFGEYESVRQVSVAEAKRLARIFAKGGEAANS
jgi:hypothetical protein